MCMKFRNLAKNKNSLKFKCTEPKSESAKKFEEKYGNVFTIVPDEHTFCRGEKTFNGKSLVSVINALVGQGKTAIEIISNTEDDAIKFMEELKKIDIKLESENE